MSRFRRLLRWAFFAVAAACLLGAAAFGVLYYVVSSRLPDVQSLRHEELQEPLYVYAKDGGLMALFGAGTAARNYFLAFRDNVKPERVAT